MILVYLKIYITCTFWPFYVYFEIYFKIHLKRYFFLIGNFCLFVSYLDQCVHPVGVIGRHELALKTAAHVSNSCNALYNQ